jgi:inosine-uridine nucleoside N-ribohydrolase
MSRVQIKRQKAMRIHIDTDLGGDIDDLCALAMVLRWDGAELTGITTVAEDRGRRAGYAQYLLAMEGREEVPVAAGADVAGGYYRYALGYPDEDRYWPEPIASFPSPVEEALKLLKASVDKGAILVGIGPFTNFALLEQRYPGILKSARIFLMGGYVYPIRKGFPQWGNDMDFNIQVDIKSAKYVMERCDATYIPLTVTVETALRRSDLSVIDAAGKLGQLIARQAEAFALDEKNEERIGETCSGLPNDLINFQHDPLACAIALGWNTGVVIEEIPLTLSLENGNLVERIDPTGKLTRVVTQVDGNAFSDFWVRQMLGN